MSIVVDASAIVDLLLGADDHVAAELAQHELHSPVTIGAEVLHALRRKWIAGQLHDDVATTAIRAFREMEITRHPIHPFLERMWSLRRNITAYDAGYVALAESLDSPLLTRDWRLAHSSGHAARIEYIA
jgi:predicted nucleic acid-binding protein